MTTSLIRKPPTGTITRFVSTAPSSFDKANRTVTAVLSKGSPVMRLFGVEKLSISKAAIDLSRLATVGIPILDSHQQQGIENNIGRLVSARVENEGRDDAALVGTIRFNDTPRGNMAAGMIERGELRGVSCGYSVSSWEIRDADGALVDPEKDRISWDDDLEYEAVRWALHECSVVSCAADAEAVIRSMGNENFAEATLARMRARQSAHEARNRMATRARMHQRASKLYD